MTTVPERGAAAAQGHRLSPALALKISRPGLWFQTLWLYLLPLTRGADWSDPWLWVGLLYATWPLNALVYGWNDSVDVELDARNPRKDSWLFGARATEAQLRRFLRIAVAAQIPFLLAFAVARGPLVALTFAGIFAVNASYNRRVGGLRGRPPFDLLNALGYLLVVVLSLQVNQRPPLSGLAWLYLGLFVTQAQLIGEVMDVVCDRQGGRVTTATRLGVGRTKIVIFALVLGLGLLCGLGFGDWVLGGLLLAGAGWLLLDLLVYAAKRETYSRTEHTIAGVGMNLLGAGSMAWQFWSPSLL